MDEVIVIDHHVTGLFTEHLAGADVGMEWSGVIPNARKSSRGRYFGEHGEGIGGTTIETPRDAIKSVDMTRAGPGCKSWWSTRPAKPLPCSKSSRTAM